MKPSMNKQAKEEWIMAQIKEEDGIGWATWYGETQRA